MSIFSEREIEISPTLSATSPRKLDTSATCETSGGAPRWVLIHYHTFKNAGSSIDESLKATFGQHWVEQEFDASGGISNAAEVREFLDRHSEVRALSSHTALLPLPVSASRRVFPIFFIRHPLLRLRSAYRFERVQGADTFGSRLARETSFAGYIEGLLETPGNRQGRDLQTYRLSFGDGSDEPEFDRAIRTLGNLPFIGLVEAFDASLRNLEQALQPIADTFVTMHVRKNASSPEHDLSIAHQLEEIRSELGEHLYRDIESRNRGDLAIFEKVAARYNLSWQADTDALS